MAKNNKTVAVLLTVCLVAVCAAVFAACETYEPCTVTFVVDGKVVDTVKTSDDGTAVFPADPQPTVGYAFDGWYDDDGNEVTSEQKIDKDMTLTARWTAVRYTVTYISRGEVVIGSDNPTSYTVESDAVTLVAPSGADGYDFAGWYDGDELFTRIPHGTPGDITLIARWTPVEYTVTYITGGAANSADNPTTYTVESETVTLAAPEKINGYDFVGWYDGDRLVTEIAQGSTGNITLTAKWAATRYDISYDLGGGVNADNPSSYTIESPSIVFAVPAVNKAGYAFVGWYDSDGARVDGIEQGTTGNLALTARWSIDPDSTPMTIEQTADGYEVTGLKSDQTIEIVIPDYVTSIGTYAFLSNTQLSKVTFDNGSALHTIGDSAFYGCSSLTEIVIPASVTTINSYAFLYCFGLEEVIFEQGSRLQTIGGGAFGQCIALADIEIPASVTSIGDGAIAQCDALAEITFGQGSAIESIGTYAFSYNPSLKYITIPASVKTLGDGALFNNEALKTVVFDKGSLLTTIGDNVFYLCPSLTEVYFGGQSAAWDAVTVGSSNDGLDSATVYCYSESAPAESGNFWHYVDGVVTRW